MPEPEQYRVDLAYRLASLAGRSAGTQSKTWFFDLAAPDWAELLHRVFYDANVGLRRREPNDENWLALDDYQVSPVSVDTMLAWDGEATAEKAAAHLPWILSSGAVTWEYTSCYRVDEAGGYDGMTGNDFSELVLYRAMAAGRVTDEQAREFLTKLYPGNGDSVFADRRDRMANLVTVRPTSAFRRAPGSRPYASGPV
ncbi:hypothetical protein [Actinoplanes subtropicus]|uniref:hypothetical protein n=1 Tax=Actinoplanes subtropicus TaxID=543632 RepID=UPI0004C386B0|nr:hypothetical protein [Actinoplanes subtropicus]